MKPSNMARPPFFVLVALAVVVMLGLQGLIEYRMVAPLETDAAKLYEDIQHLRSNPTPEAPSRLRTTVRLDEILARLEKQDANDARIERLHQMADDNGVVLRKASYRNQTIAGDISRHEIQADLAGVYPAIRQFLRDLLAQDEAAAVESLEFSRPHASVGSAGVRAQVRLTLYSRRITP